MGDPTSQFPSYAPNASALPYAVKLKGWAFWTTLLGSLAGLLLALFVGGMFILRPQMQPRDVLLIQIPLLLVAIYCGLRLWRLKDPELVLFPDRLERRGLLNSRVLHRSELAGVSKNFSSRYGSYFNIIPQPGSGGSFRLNSSLRQDRVFAEWLRGAPDPDAVAAAADKASVLADPRYGGGEPERAAWLDRAKRLVGVITIGCWAAAAWVFIFAEPDLLAVGVAAACAAIGLVLVMVSNGLIVWWRPAGARPAVAVTLLPAAALSIRALTTIHLLHFAPLLIAGIAVGGVGAILCFQRDGLAASRLQSSLVAGAFAGLVASGAAALLNTLGDTAPGRSFTVTVEDKHESRGRSTSYYLDLAPWADQPARSVSVPFRLYEAVEVGANVCIDRYPGGLGLAWFDIGLCRTAGLKTRDQYMAAGEALVEAGDYKGGVRQIDQAILLDPGFGFAWELRAIAHARLGDLRDAQADAMKAVALAPNSLVAFRSQGLLAEITVHPRDAITAFGKAIASNPKDSYSLQRRATAELQVGSYEAALKDLDAALALNPGDSVSLEMKASAYRALGRLDDIRKEAASLDSESTAQAVLLTRVQLFAMARDDADALSVLDRAIRLKPTSAAYDARAQLRAGTDLTGARSDAEEALALDPASEPAARILAWLDDRAGRSADALAVIDQAIANHPDAAGLYFSRASLLAKTGKTTDLPAVFAAIRQRVGGNPVLLNDLCWEQAIRGVSLQLALADCDAALRILPDFPAALDSRAYVLLRLGRYREASDAYAAALQRLPKFPSSLFGRSIVEARLGQSEASARDAAAARMLDPKISSSFPPV